MDRREQYRRVKPISHCKDDWQFWLQMWNNFGKTKDDPGARRAYVVWKSLNK